MLSVEAQPAVFKTVIDQCMYGLSSKDDDGSLNPAMKASSFLTNCAAMHATLPSRCSRPHPHTILQGGNRTRKAQVYPPKLAQAIVDSAIHRGNCKRHSAGYYQLQKT